MLRSSHSRLFGLHSRNDNRRKLSRYLGGGQNLSDRYLRLEKSLRGREALSKELAGYSQSSSSIQSTPLSKSSSKPLQIFRGFEIPEEPKPPADDECCMSGCAVCVYDLYEETLEAYKEAVLSLRNSLSALHIPQNEWPSSIRQQGSSEPNGPDKRREMVLNAFEEMERTLKLKRESEAEAQARS
ncbi:hypothetical protein BYT27DRAFT_7081618 [Phlegmacium glaucopus]|nr:hypothetical protein BYT27DRAFT_7081618 [Phlegmacium glaucopus]